MGLCVSLSCIHVCEWVGSCMECVGGGTVSVCVCICVCMEECGGESDRCRCMHVGGYACMDTHANMSVYRHTCACYWLTNNSNYTSIP